MLRCSRCGKPIAQHMLGPGNTFSVRCWTDGKQESPLFPDQPRLVKCPHCCALVWLDDEEKIGEVSWGAPSQAAPVDTTDFDDAIGFSLPALQEYFAFLANAVLDPSKEKYVRMRLWWAGNDVRRPNATAKIMAAEERDNLLAFSFLLDESDDEQRLMKAEALRELGHFALAETLLSQPLDPGLFHAAAVITHLIDQQETRVREIKF